MKRTLLKVAAMIICGILPTMYASAVSADDAAILSETDSILVYIGTYGEDAAPLFQYYTPRKSGDYRCKTCYAPELPNEYSYGDILAAEGLKYTGHSPISGASDFQKITEYSDLRYVGNCAELTERKTLTISAVTRQDANFIAQYETNELHIVALDSKETRYSYGVETYGCTFGIDIKGVFAGDTMEFAIFNDTAILPLSAPVHITEKMGDVNLDGLFRSEDVILLRDWLLGNAELKDWTAADYNGDGKLNAADLTLMKRALSNEPPAEYCDMTVQTDWVYSPYNGNEEKGSFTESFPVLSQDCFFENSKGHWLKNEKNSAQYVQQTITVERFDETGVTVTFSVGSSQTVAYGEPFHVPSVSENIYDGTRYIYTVIFSKQE